MAALTGFRHTDRGVWSADASDLGLAPGDWPITLVADLGYRVVTATRSAILRREGDVTHAVYQASGVTLKVWND